MLAKIFLTTLSLFETLLDSKKRFFRDKAGIPTDMNIYKVNESTVEQIKLIKEAKENIAKVEQEMLSERIKRYAFPILRVLSFACEEARTTGRVCEQVINNIKPSEYELKTLNNKRSRCSNDIRWVYHEMNKGSLAELRMVNTPNEGIWEITDKGLKYVKDVEFLQCLGLYKKK